MIILYIGGKNELDSTRHSQSDTGSWSSLRSFNTGECSSTHHEGCGCGWWDSFSSVFGCYEARQFVVTSL